MDMSKIVPESAMPWLFRRAAFAYKARIQEGVFN
jgi:hypothetical protein